MSAIWELKEALDGRLKLVERGARYKKAEWIEFLEELSKEAERLDDNLHDECYSPESARDLAEEMLDEMKRDQERELQRIDAEEHRKRFGVIEGGAA